MTEFEPRQREVERELSAFIDRGGRVVIVKAPPGSGKTTLLLSVLGRAAARKMRIAVGTQTNSQADDVCTRLLREQRIAPIRFASSSYDTSAVPAGATVISRAGQLPAGPGIVVGPVAKWGYADNLQPYDVFVVDEAWQMSWASFMLCQAVAGRFVFIGDPGQIDPVVSIDTSRWETSRRPPHRAVPEILEADPPADLLRLELPASRRLPADSVEVVRQFYDFEFGAWSKPGDRRLTFARPPGDKMARALDGLSEGSIVAAALPTPEGGPPLELDEGVARVAVGLAQRLLERGAACTIADDTRRKSPFSLKATDIGISATHRILNTRMELLLPDGLRGNVRVDTAERWQGLERPVMIVVHPLSGVTRPSAFDLATGRLCVMASRHQVGLIVVTRDHVGTTLDEFLPSGEQPLGRPDVVGRGHQRHLGFWRVLKPVTTSVEPASGADEARRG